MVLYNLNINTLYYRLDEAKNQVDKLVQRQYASLPVH